MKKINSLLIGVSILFAGFFTTSCNKDTTAPSPTVTFINGVTSGTASNGSYTISGTAKAPGEFEKIQFFTVTTTNGSTIETELTSLRITSFTNDTIQNFQVNLSNLTTTTVIKVMVTDKNGSSGSATFTINVSAAAGNITSYTAKLIGAESNNSVGSAFSTSSGNVYNQSQAISNSTSVDFLYFYSSTVGVNSEIISPLYGSVNWSSYVTWSNPNSTKFARTTAITSAEFDAMTDDSKITSIVSSITWNTDERVVSLAIGDIFAFKTASGKYGLTKVTGLTAGADGSITISVNVQQ